METSRLSRRAFANAMGEKQLRGMARIVATVAALAVALVLPLRALAAGATPPAVSCASLSNLAIPNTLILSVQEVPATATVSAYCSVTGVINKRVSAQDPDHFTYGIGFQVNLPDAWVGRFEMQGGGGTDGSLSPAVGTAGIELGTGWAVASNDGGHQDVPAPPLNWSDDDANAGGAQHFGLDEQSRIDYGYNGIAATTSVAKRIIAQYYHREPAYSYLSGCSNGGRDGMKALQTHPDMFDGVISGDPGFDLPRAALAEAWNEQVLAKLATRYDVNNQPYIPDTLQPQDLEVASAAILSACDRLDGLVDGIIDNFPACTRERVYPALSEFTCSPKGKHGSTPHAGTCLTADQVAAIKAIYEGPKTSSGERLYSHWYWDAGIWDPPSAFGAGFALWNVGGIQASGPLSNNALNLTLGAGALPMVFMTPPDVTPVAGTDGQEAYMFAYDFDQNAARIFKRAPGYGESSMEFMAAVNTDLTPFVRHGGKLIIYTAVNDGIFSGVDIVNWYNALNQANDQKAANFARLFMIPNMAHCGGGPATNSFATNALTAITDWVEAGKAPERIVAANLNTASPFPSGGLFDPRVAQNFPTGGTRPLCPYPQQSRYKGSGATGDAANFVCVTPKEGDQTEDDGFYKPK
ncbi:MAG: tannase/feruloyl esterase family alpha/beta hydrolase [Burkholderiaceae bacterium]